MKQAVKEKTQVTELQCKDFKSTTIINHFICSNGNSRKLSVILLFNKIQFH